MYYTEINGKQEGFESQRTRHLIAKIVSSARLHKRVCISYTKTTTQRGVHRNIAPYSYKDGWLYVTDEKDGTRKIKGLLAANIIRACRMQKGFIPRWEIKL